MDQPSPTRSECLEHAALTDVGMRRASNQDSHAVVLANDAESWSRRGHVFMVADGMGAHAAGELASKMAADGIPHTYHKRPDKSPASAIRRTVEEINSRINHRGETNPDFRGMGTTCSVLVLLPQGAMVAHVGDSRIYRLRGTRLEQLTFDHSLVWEMAAAGQLQGSSSAAFVPKNIITRSLGPRPAVQVDLEGPFPLEVGDTFMLCSDGLTGQVKDEEIGVLLACLPPADAVKVLIDLANLRGGPDNITVIVVRVTGAGITYASGAGAEPLVIGGDEQPAAKTVHPAVWITAGAGLVLGLVLGGVGWIWPAIACAVVGVAAGIYGLLSKLPFSGGTDLLPPGARLGKGPHVSIECPPNQQVVDSLIQIVEQLREAGMEGSFSVDWDRFQTYRRKGLAFSASQDFTRAVQEFCRAIHFMMSQLRGQRARNYRKPSDSEVDLL